MYICTAALSRSSGLGRWQCCRRQIEAGSSADIGLPGCSFARWQQPGNEKVEVRLTEKLRGGAIVGTVSGVEMRRSWGYLLIADNTPFRPYCCKAPAFESG